MSFMGGTGLAGAGSVTGSPPSYGGIGDPGGPGGGMGPGPSSSGGGTDWAGMIGAGLKTIGPLLSGMGQRNAANANAETSRLMAESVRREAEERAQARLRESARIASQGRANFAKAGVDVDSGTPLLVELASKEAGEADARAIRETGQAKGRYHEAQAKQSQQQGSNSLMDGLLGAGAGFMSSGAGKGLLS